MNTGYYGTRDIVLAPSAGKNELYKNQRGSTLIEALVAIAILTIGILTVMVMQTQAIRASSSAMNRTEANSVALSIMETIKELGFNNDNIKEKNVPVDIDDLAAVSTRQELQNLIDADKLTTFDATDFPQLEEIISKPSGATDGTVVDKSGVQYTLAWAALDNMKDDDGNVIGKTIWLLMYWDSLMGTNKVQMTSLKYKNAAL